MESIRIIKIGGNVINKPEKLDLFLKELASFDGYQILVHGGGRTATEVAEKLEVPTEMIDGKRKTNAQMLDVCTMVYAGLINKNIIATLQKYQCNAIGLSGADANFIPATIKSKTPIDFGYIGIPKKDKFPIQTLQALLNAGITPVFCALTHDENGQMLNTNADTIASILAIGASKVYQTTLVYCFEKKGVLSDATNDDSVIEHINASSYETLKNEKIITDGMIPKLDGCFDAISAGVHQVIIKHADHLNQSIGTTISL